MSFSELSKPVWIHTEPSNNSGSSVKSIFKTVLIDGLNRAIDDECINRFWKRVSSFSHRIFLLLRWQKLYLELIENTVASDVLWSWRFLFLSHNSLPDSTNRNVHWAHVRGGGESQCVRRFSPYNRTRAIYYYFYYDFARRLCVFR